MRFNAVDPKVPSLLLFFLMLVIFLISKWLIFLAFAIFLIISTQIKYQFVINDTNLSFVTSIFGLNILQREANKENIKLIEFKRIGWHQKSVFIRLTKGVSWRIFRFQPDKFDEFVEKFATDNSIKIKKHKNY